MGLLRLVAIFFVGLGAYLLCSDLIGQAASGTFAPRTLEYMWRTLEPNSLGVLRGALGEGSVQGSVFTWLTKISAWLAFVLVGALVGGLDLLMQSSRSSAPHSRFRKPK